MVTGLGPERVTKDIEDVASKFYASLSTPERYAHDVSASDAKEKIIAATARLIEREGLASVTNRAVAKEAGVSLASTTYHFASVAELAVAGFRRIFDLAHRQIVDDPPQRNFAQGLRQRVKARNIERSSEYARSRGTTEISLAASRGILPWTMGLEMRQQRGSITFTAASVHKSIQVSRLKAASLALWSSAVSITAASITGGEKVFDFEDQAELALSKLLLLK